MKQKIKPLSAFCRKSGIELLIISGSRAAGLTTPSSDIDLAVQFKNGLEASKLDLLYELDTILHPEPVDLVILTPDTTPLLRYEIFFRGRVLLEEAEGLFELGKLKAWKLYSHRTLRSKWSESKFLREVRPREA